MVKHRGIMESHSDSPYNSVMPIWMGKDDVV